MHLRRDVPGQDHMRHSAKVDAEFINPGRLRIGHGQIGGHPNQQFVQHQPRGPEYRELLQRQTREIAKFLGVLDAGKHILRPEDGREWNETPRQLGMNTRMPWTVISPRGADFGRHQVNLPRDGPAASCPVGLRSSHWSGVRPAKRARRPRASSMRSASFHFAMRSERAKEPTLSCGTPHPIARWTMVTSSLSPDRAEMIAPQPVLRAASSAASASVMVPAWFGFTNTALQAPNAAAFVTRSALVTRKSSPTICTRCPTA